MKTIRFMKWDCVVEKHAYQNGRTCLQLVDSEDGEPIATATINVPEIHLEQNEVIIKNYSENEGILDCLIENEYIVKTGKQVEIGFTTCEICLLLK